VIARVSPAMPMWLVGRAAAQQAATASRKT